MASTDLLVPHLSKIRVPNARDLIYKDECVFSFDNPETESGLFVSLNSFLGFGRSFVEPYFQKSGNAVFLHIRREKKALPLPEHTGDGPEKKITRLAIGIEGGFDPDVASNKYEYTDHYAIVVLPNFATIPWPNDALPDVVKKSVQGVISAESPNKLAELATLAGTWDGEARVISKFAENLQQLDNGVKIPPTGWKCEKCDLTTNLWLNLTDGSILCGRRFFDGSGGNDHAVEHYRATGFPLAVKLGTITPDGQADVFSYAEDDMVLDPNLTEHLKHFGINAKNLEKTEKSMAELELELNKSGGEWHTMCESSSELRPLDGPGLTGINNLGNTCYINSVVQVIFRMPDFVRRFIESAPEVFNSFPPDPVNDFNVQMAKLGVGLMSGRYSLPAEGDSQPGISPHMFRNLIGKRHPEFSTKRQQDVMEFFMHLVNMIERHSVGRDNPTDCLRFTQEERVVCAASNGVRYTRVDSTALSLPVPLAAAVNADQVRQYEARRHQAEALGQRLDPGAIVRPQIPFLACLEGFLKEELIEQYYSTAVKTLTNAIKTTRLATFPDYLLVQLKKFMLKPDWTPAKLDVEVQMPWEVDLSMLRGHTRRPDEILLPEVVEETPQPTFNQALMSQLMEMGFPPEACKKSLYFTQNQGLEAASNWLMEHIGDSDFADTFIVPGSKSSSAASEIELSQDAIASLTCLGFTEAQAKAALRRTDGNAERAADFLLSHPDEVLESTAAAQQNAEPNHAPQVRDGSSKYRLVAFISHMGTSSTVGHYVCHILHEGRWVIFNDNKVALSENPPKDLAYLYLYERV